MLFKRPNVDAKIYDLPPPLGGEATLKFQIGKYALLHISGKVFWDKKILIKIVLANDDY